MPRLDVVGVIVSDLQTAIAFYARLGLRFPGNFDPYRELAEAGSGGYKEPWDAFWGQRYAQVTDPDGNVIDLFAPLA